MSDQKRIAPPDRVRSLPNEQVHHCILYIALVDEPFHLNIQHFYFVQFRNGVLASSQLQCNVQDYFTMQMPLNCVTSR